MYNFSSNKGGFHRYQKLEETAIIEGILQKAVEVCWDRLPPNEREIGRLEAEMLRLTNKVVRSFHENLLSGDEPQGK